MWPLLLLVGVGALFLKSSSSSTSTTPGPVGPTTPAAGSLTVKPLAGSPTVKSSAVQKGSAPIDHPESLSNNLPTLANPNP
jgi:hypothetical protein